MLTSPITVTISGTDHSLSRINNDNFSSVYLKKWALNELRLTIRHSKVGKGVLQSDRHNVELIHTVWDAEGNSSVRKSYTVAEVGAGIDPATIAALTTGLNTFVTANITAIAGWES